MVKILGLLDFAAAGLLVALSYPIEIPRTLVIMVAVLLIFKALIFLMDPTSFLDIGAGALLIIGLSVSLPIFLTLPVAIFVGFKGIMSLAAV
jgi:hypothetical protein